jgi:hypothetical protein
LTTAHAPGATWDRARHHLRNDDADDAELAVLSALVVKSDAWYLCRGSARGLSRRKIIYIAGGPGRYNSATGKLNHYTVFPTM